MDRPWIYAVVGACGLFVVVVGLRHFRGSETEATHLPYTRVASIPKRMITQHSGWSARVGSEARGDQPTGGAGARGAPFRRGTTGGSAVTSGGSAGNRGGATALTDPSRRGFRSAGPLPLGAKAAAGGGIQVDVGTTAGAVPFKGGKSLRDITEARVVNPYSGHDAAGTSTTGDAAADAPEDGGPVLSLPFDGTVEPDRGDTNVFEQGVTFDSGEGAVFTTDSQFIVPNGGNITGDAGTVSFWLQPEWEGGDQSNASLVQLRNQNVWENRLQVFKNGKYLRFLLTDASGVESNIGATIDNWAPGEWHQVTATWGEALQSFYVDGKLIGQVTYSGQLNVANGTPLYIGSDHPNGVPGANGAISQFQVYDRALPAQEVSNLVLGGAPQ